MVKNYHSRTKKSLPLASIDGLAGQNDKFKIQKQVSIGYYKNYRNYFTISERDIPAAEFPWESLQECLVSPNNLPMHCGSRLDPVLLLDWEKANAVHNATTIFFCMTK